MKNFLIKLIKLNLKNKKKYFYKNKNNLIIPNIITRFPPEPNFYLHIGHIKSIYLNFQLAKQYKGRCHIRFDDTNPNKEEKKYIFNIINSIKWFNYKYIKNNKKYIYFASNYFNKMYNFAKNLILLNKAYIDEQNIKQIFINKGSFLKTGINSFCRNYSIKKSLKLFKEMKNGKFINSKLCLRAKINMLSKNLNLRDPIIYRIRHNIHYNTNKKWCIYPTYIYAHPIEDVLENISHSICTLEFEDQKPFYNWLLNNLFKKKYFLKFLPKQYEISKLNINYFITSKRILKKIIKKKILFSLKDIRISSILSLKKKGYIPKIIKIFCKYININKNVNFINYKFLENSFKKYLIYKIPIIIAIIKPIKIIINNFYKKNYFKIKISIFNKKNKLFNNKFKFLKFLKYIFIEENDFIEYPINNFYRLFPGNKIILIYSFLIECIGYNKNKNYIFLYLNCIYFKNIKKKKIKYLHWISKKNFSITNIILYKNLFNNPNINFKKKIKKYLNIFSKKKKIFFLEKIKKLKFKKIYQFLRKGFYIKKYKKKKIIFNNILL